MDKKVVIIKPDGTKKIIVGKETTSKPIPSNGKAIESSYNKVNNNNKSTTGRAKPIVTKAGLTKEKNAYKYGGKTTRK